jgi:hypothetical protein
MDLHHWSQWHLVFQYSLGPLEDFLRREGAAAAGEYYELVGRKLIL